jgi:hypothetical protein
LYGFIEYNTESMEKKISLAENPLIKKSLSLERRIVAADAELSLAEKRLSTAIDEPTRDEYLTQLGIAEIKTHIASLRQLISKLGTEKGLLRNDSEADSLYRTRLRTEFPEILRDNLSDDSEIRFHGTGIVNAHDIIVSGEISSSIERGLGVSSFDASNQISVTDRDNIELTINDYIGIKDRVLPIGCVFVLLPKNAADAKSSSSGIMRNVELRSNGRVSPQLVRILCSSEMLDEVRVWLEENGFGSDLASDFFEFAQHPELENQTSEFHILLE